MCPISSQHCAASLMSHTARQQRTTTKQMVKPIQSKNGHNSALTLCCEEYTRLGQIRTTAHLFVQPLTYAYNTQLYQSASATPYSLTLTRRPPGLQTHLRNSPIPAKAQDETSTEALRKRLEARDPPLRSRTGANCKKRKSNRNQATAVPFAFY